MYETDRAPMVPEKNIEALGADMSHSCRKRIRFPM